MSIELAFVLRGAEFGERQDEARDKNGIRGRVGLEDANKAANFRCRKLVDLRALLLILNFLNK